MRRWRICFFFCTFIICHSPQKSSGARKVYKPDREPLLDSTSPSALTRCHLPYRGEALAFRKVFLPSSKFSSPPEAPLLGELSSEARLRGCTKESLTDMPMAPPLGELAGVSPTERARMLTANPRRCDSIALTKSLPIAAQRFLENGLALSVTFGDTSPKGRGFGYSVRLRLFAQGSPFGRGFARRSGFSL